MNEKATDIDWETTPRQNTVKNRDWFLSVIIIGIAITLSAIMFGNLLFATLLFIASTTILIIGGQKPEKIKVKITDRGIKINNQLFVYDKLASFWIDEESTPNRLSIQTESIVTPFINIPIADISPTEIRQFLLKHVTEIEHQKNIISRIVDYLGI